MRTLHRMVSKAVKRAQMRNRLRRSSLHRLIAGVALACACRVSSPCDAAACSWVLNNMYAEAEIE